MTMRACKDCRFSRPGTDPAWGHCRRMRPAPAPGGFTFPAVLFGDVTVPMGENEDGQPITKVLPAARSWCFQFKRRRFWHRWFDTEPS